MTEISEKRTQVGQKYSTEQVELGLLACALSNGNTRKAAQVLAADKDNGFEINQATLHRWIQRDPERYAAIQAREMPAIRTRAADAWAQLSELQAEAAEKATHRLLANIDEIPIDKLSQTVHHSTLSGAISTDKAREYRGEATQVIEHRTASEVLRKLQSRGLVIEGQVESEEDVTEAVGSSA